MSTRFAVRYMTFGQKGFVQTAPDYHQNTSNAIGARNTLFKQDEIWRCWLERVKGHRTVERYGDVLKKEPL